ncbi:MAG: L-2-amino-thiazoline-4-carboxylic acid hydrolase [Chloroflexota bacterium]|nr:L-2-amino-thiazoline-4-carboxylic acid hydrolase [Chloroflexota bacterium]
MTRQTKSNTILKYTISFGLGALGGFLAGVIASNRLNAASRMPYAASWERVLAREHGHVEANCIINRVESRYWQLFCQRPRLVDLALRDHLHNQILPGLALYQVLREEGQAVEVALSTVERLVDEARRGKRLPIVVLGRLPIFYQVLRRMTPNFLTRNFPARGWEIEWVEDSESSLAFNMRSCFYLEIFQSYGAPELTLVYCKMDDLLFDDVSPYVRWERTGTLARGDDVCDFRWTRV